MAFWVATGSSSGGSAIFIPLVSLTAVRLTERCWL